MTPAQQQAFLMGSGIQASSLNLLFRLGIGLLMIVTALFILIGLMKLLEEGHSQHQLRFLLHLFGLSVLLMIFFIFIVA